MATVTIATRSLKKGKAYVIHFNNLETGRKEYHKTLRRKIWPRKKPTDFAP